MVRSLDIVGAGRLGRTLGHLFQASGAFAVRSVLSASPASADDAVRFIGAGRAAADLADLEPADVLLVATPDAAIEETASRIAAFGAIGEGAVVFHCSGALSSAVLAPARAAGAHVASVHPVMTFPDPARVVGHFEGTHCGCEGDAAALEVLEPAFEAIGGTLFRIDADRKTFYHAGAVMACNLAVALLESGLRCFELAGVARPEATAALSPLVTETVRATLRDGPVAALTGPIARGDADVVAHHLAALVEHAAPLADAYRALGRIAVELAEDAGNADPAGLASITRTLGRS